MAERGPFWVYVMAHSARGAIYVGVTNDLISRAYEHRARATKGHTSRYNITKLVYFEEYDSIDDAIAREKQLKRWRRAWKVELIEGMNPTWRDLVYALMDDETVDAPPREDAD